MAKFSELSSNSKARWNKRLNAIGIDYSMHNRPLWRTVHVNSLEEFAEAFQSAPAANLRSSIVDGRSVESLSADEMRRAAQEHVFGSAPISDPAIRAELSRRLRPFVFDAMVAPDIIVTATNPLIIDSGRVVTAYGTVTIEDGGYIDISVPCHFQAEVVVKGSGGGGAVADFVVHGVNGTPGNAGAVGYTGVAGANGAKAVANCSGSDVPATPGQPGQGGGDGVRGLNGTNGSDGPTVQITINDLRSSITVVNSGGNGGNGG
ncbi:MAG TPA: hypothetical protein VEB64_08065, partial [Azospirillaceae bacterium]|nr:hypothetical protein [Azospirillaceae bacterium]